MIDNFKGRATGFDSPPSQVIAVAPSDTADLIIPSRALNVALTGTVRVTTTDGTTADIYVAAGITFPVRATRVWATGTTASGIVALS